MTFPKTGTIRNSEEALIKWDDFICELAEAMNDEAAIIEELNRKAENDQASIQRREAIFG